MSLSPEGVVLALFALCTGACVGSFVNVLIYRLPREKSVVSPGSHCFCCGTPLRARDLVPVFSYLLSGGRCRYCGVALSGQYALVEAACALLFAALAVRWGATLTLLVYAVAAAAMMAAFGTDVRGKIIPTVLNQVIFAAGVLGAALAALLPADLRPGLPTVGYSLLGAVVGFVLFEAIVRLGRWWFGQEAMGGGDVLLVAAVGALLGPGAAFWTFFLVSLFTALAVCAPLLLLSRVGRRQAVPFGPFLVAGALTVMLWPELPHALARLEGFGGH